MSRRKYRTVCCASCGRDVLVKISPQSNVCDNYCLECAAPGWDNLPSEAEGRGALRSPEWFSGVPHEETGHDDWFAGEDDDIEEGK